MAALPIIPNYAIITQLLNDADELHVMANKFCVNVSTGSPTLSQMATQFAASYASALLPCMISGISMGQTEVTLLDGTTPTGTFTTASAGSSGSISTGSGFPLSMAQVITWQTAHRGRSYRGRTFLPGISSSMVVDPRVRALTNTQAALLQTAANALPTALGAGAHAQTLAVLSLKLGIATPVNAQRGNANVCSQRRRYEKVAHD